MNELTAQQINSITQVLNDAGSQAVQQYAAWHFTNAVVWLLVGIAMVAAAVIGLTATYKLREKIDGPGFNIGICLVALIVGLLLVGNNITNLFEPTAYAIHQLIIDIRG